MSTPTPEPLPFQVDTPTEPISIDELLDKLLDDPSTPENEADEVRKRVPEPALFRGVVVAFVGLVGAAIGVTVDQAWIDLAVGTYALAAPLGLAWWIRRNVTPTARHRR